MLVSASKVALDLASPTASYPACTAEELPVAAVIDEWQALLDSHDLGQPWADLTEYLLQDLDFQYLFSEQSDGIENDVLAAKTRGIDVRPVGEWFVPFGSDDIVRPFATSTTASAALYDLTREGKYADPTDKITSLTPVTGVVAISDLVAHDRAALASHASDWILLDASAPASTMRQLTTVAGTSGWLRFQAGPDEALRTGCVLNFRAPPHHPATGAAWAAVVLLNGRLELPLSAVVAFRSDLAVELRWQQSFTGLG